MNYIPHFWTALLCWASFTGSALSQEPYLPNIKKMSRGELDQLVRATQDTDKLRGMAAEILASGRLDVIEISVHLAVWPHLSELIERLPNSDYKEAIALIMLKSDDLNYVNYSQPGLDPDNPPTVPLLSGYPFRDVVMKHLPGVPLEDRLVSTPASRSSLWCDIQELQANPSDLEKIKARLKTSLTEDIYYNAGHGLTAPEVLPPSKAAESESGKISNASSQSNNATRQRQSKILPKSTVVQRKDIEAGASNSSNILLWMALLMLSLMLTCLIWWVPRRIAGNRHEI